MARGEVADVQEGPGVAHERMRLALREEALLDATLIEHLDGARVKTPGSLAVEILAGASFDDDDVDPRQRQLGRKHQPGRATSCDHHGMFGHRPIPGSTSVDTVVRSVDRLHEISPRRLDARPNRYVAETPVLRIASTPRSSEAR